MKLPYSLFIALRYLKSRKRQKAISFITLISIGGVAVGVMALIIVLSVMSGFHEDLQRKILGISTHILVFSYDKKITNYMEVGKELDRIQGVEGTSPFILGQVMVSNNKNPTGVFLRGVLPELEKNTTDIGKFIKDGDFNKLGQIERGIVIGTELSKNMALDVGDYINVISPFGEIGPLGMVPKARRFQIVALFEVGMYEYDTSLVVTNLKSAQEFFAIENAVTGMEVKVRDIYKAPIIKEKILETLGFPYYAKDWKEMNKNLFAALQLEKFTMFIILTLIVLVASFNIVSTLVMNVMEKEREVAILRTMGATKGGILWIFMFQGLAIGVIGTFLGGVVGAIVCYFIDNYELIRLPGDVYYLTYLPAKLQFGDITMVCVLAVLISFLSTIYPSYRASKIDPVEPLRFE